MGFDEKHLHESAVVISQSMAKKFWPNQNALGQRIRFGEDDAPWLRVVGIVGDVRISLDREPQPSMYVPLSDSENPNFYAVIHSSTDPAMLAPAVRQILGGLDPDIPAFDIRTMAGVLDESAARHKFTAFLLGLFAALAVVLAAVGLYGVLSYAVAQRRAEIGIRMALGAAHSQVRRLILVEGLRPAVAGVILGILGAAWATQFLRNLLFGVGTDDALTFLAVPLVLFGVALAACAIPAWRATRVDPATALRSEMLRVLEDLQRTRSLDGRHLGGGAATELLAAVAQGLEMPPGTLRLPPAHDLDQPNRAVTTLATAFVAQRAGDLELDPAILATRADLVDFLQDPPRAGSPADGAASSSATGCGGSPRGRPRCRSTGTARSCSRSAPTVLWTRRRAQAADPLTAGPEDQRLLGTDPPAVRLALRRQPLLAAGGNLDDPGPAGRRVQAHVTFLPPETNNHHPHVPLPPPSERHHRVGRRDELEVAAGEGCGRPAGGEQPAVEVKRPRKGRANSAAALRASASGGQGSQAGWPARSQPWSGLWSHGMGARHPSRPPGSTTRSGGISASSRPSSSPA